jgi:hypothetical protein
MFGLIFATIVATAATPGPRPTPQLKVIANVKSDSLCSSLHDTIVPVAYVTHRDDEAFAALNHSMLKFLQQIPGVRASSIADLNTLDTSLDNAELYSPSAELSVVQMNKIADEIAQNVTLEGRVMDASWKHYPKGKFSNVDAFRQRLQNMIDLQRALEEKYFQFTQMYLDNRNQEQYAPNVSVFEAFLHETIAGYGSALAAAQGQSDPEVPPKADAHDVARSGSIAQVVEELRLQELAFAQEIVTAGRTCGIVPAPQPTTPK